MNQLEASKKAGKVNRQAIDFGFSYAVPGTLVSDLDDALGEFIKSFEGCKPAFYGYQGFPANACINRNDEVVHGVPKRGHRIKNGDILTIDIGTMFEGWCTDAAETHIVGEPKNQDHVRLIEGSKAILNSAVNEVKSGVTLYQIAITSQKTAKEFGLNIYPNLGGHQIGKLVHEGFVILHTTEGVDYPSIQMLKCTTLQSNHFICLEPIVTLGIPEFVTHRDGWTLKSKDGCYSAQQEVMLVVNEGGHEVLS